MRGAATRHGRTLFLATAALWSATSACAQEPARVVQALSPDREAVQTRAQAVFAPLPDEVANPENPVTDAKVVLGRTLYFDPRLSKNHDISCNSCHPLGRFGADGESTSPGHRGQRGGRNSPTVYNAAVHLAQFWDGRAADVEAQAKGPILNPIEMAMPSEAAVLDVLDSIPGYAPLFAAAFPDTAEPITYDNLARAIGAFERRLLTPTRFDAFLSGDAEALREDEVRGLEAFLDTGCTMCHQGVGVGGGMYQKLGLVRPYPTEDVGRAAVTGNDAEKHFFKVPSLRNIAETAPYFHDGSIATLDEAIRTMAAIQLGRDLSPEQVRRIGVFLEALTGELHAETPKLPESGPETPAPDPT
jgi:cytochrome c peroxidase